jgi:WhiB family redox-sensing transcriptional regulator
MRPSFFKEAACRGVGLDYFFPGQGQSSRMKKAMEMCAVCPVLEQCFKYAFDNRIEHGVWGGTSAEERIDLVASYSTSEDAWNFKTTSD